MADSEELQERAHQNPVAFLGTELDLGFTFVQTAMIEAEMGNREHYERSVKNAESAIDVVRRFGPRIHDPEALREIQAKASELTKAISSLPDLKRSE